MRFGRWAAPLLLGVAPGAWAAGVELRVAHTPRPCALAGQPARIEARFEPASDAVRARVYFHSEGEGPFYAVEMHREGEVWAGVLPSPADGTTRIAYFITAAAEDSRVRAPASSAFVADVVREACAEGATPVSAAGPSEVIVPRGAPQVPPGFERRGIGAFVEAAVDEPLPATPPRITPAQPLGVLPVPLGSDVRAVTSSGNRQQEGKLVSLDGEALVLDAKGSPVRVPRSDLVRLEVKEKGSSSMRVLGGLIGGLAGLAVTALVCASADCESIGVAWAGFGVGVVAGAALTGGDSWRPVTLASAGPVAIELKVRKAAAAVEMRLGF